MACVKPISQELARKVIEAKHYSHRLGICWEAFGLFLDDILVAVICYGQPSASIQKYAFKNRDFRLYELTRLVIDSGIKNGASMLISGSLKLLKEQHAAIVSYADSAHGHCGIVYQAANWLYTGAVKAHDSLYIVNGEKLHSRTVMDRFGVTNPVGWARQNNVVRIKPENKHRYFYLLGTHKQKLAMLELLRYPIVKPYPKADKKMYKDGPSCQAIG